MPQDPDQPAVRTMPKRSKRVMVDVSHSERPAYEDYVRRTFLAPCDTCTRSYATESACRSLIGNMFVNILVSQPDHVPSWDTLVYNTLPPNYRGPNTRSEWIETTQSNKVELRITGNKIPGALQANVSMWTKDSSDETIRLRTLIDTTGPPLIHDGHSWVYTTYFTPSVQDLRRNQGRSIFNFRVDVSVCE